MRTPLAKTFAVVGLSLAACGIAACGDTTSRTTASAPDAASTVGSDKDTTPSTVEVHSIDQLFRGVAIDGAYTNKPSELASWSDVVVTGYIDSIVRGPWYDGVGSEAVPVKTVIMVLNVKSIEAGKRDLVDNGHVYIQLFAGGGVDAQAFNDVAPRDSLMVLYLSAADFFKGQGADNPHAGSPESATVLHPKTRGMFLERDGQVVDLIDGSRFSATVDQFLPTSQEFPPVVGAGAGNTGEVVSIPPSSS